MVRRRAAEGVNESYCQGGRKERRHSDQSAALVRGILSGADPLYRGTELHAGHGTELCPASAASRSQDVMRNEVSSITREGERAEGRKSY